jgi:hypothetical protein
LSQDRNLAGNLVGGKEIIGIQPLNVITLAERERGISGSGGALVLLRDNADALGFKAARDRFGLVGGPIIYYDDFLPGPCLSHRRPERIGNPLLCVEGRN